MSESQKQRLERIAVQLLSGAVAEAQLARYPEDRVATVRAAVHGARELMKQIDELPPIE